MSGITLTSANQYAKMSLSFFQEYHLIDEEYQKALSSYEEGQVDDYKVFALLIEKEEKAIAAVVFQAFAIEAYINLLGITIFGEDDFYHKKIGNTKIERMPTLQKLDIICSELSVNYPEPHRQKIDALFKKRDSLVHQKPHLYTATVQPFEYDHPEESYKEYYELMKPLKYLFSNLEEEMILYSELQENIRVLRGVEKELIEEIMEQEMKENAREMADAIQSLFDTKSDGETL